MNGGFVLSWTSGHTPPRRLFMREHAKGWGATEDRSIASVFPSAKKALGAWLSKHTFPGNYQKEITIGMVRAEPLHQPTLPFYMEKST